MKRILISAYCKIHADYYAREVLRIPNSQWFFIDDAYRLRGQRGRELIFVNAPRHRPTLMELEKRDYIFETCLACGVDIKRVELP